MATAEEPTEMRSGMLSDPADNCAPGDWPESILTPKETPAGSCHIPVIPPEIAGMEVTHIERRSDILDVSFRTDRRIFF